MKPHLYHHQWSDLKTAAGIQSQVIPGIFTLALLSRSDAYFQRYSFSTHGHSLQFVPFCGTSVTLLLEQRKLERAPQQSLTHSNQSRSRYLPFPSWYKLHTAAIHLCSNVLKHVICLSKHSKQAEAGIQAPPSSYHPKAHCYTVQASSHRERGHTPTAVQQQPSGYSLDCFSLNADLLANLSQSPFYPNHSVILPLLKTSFLTSFISRILLMALFKFS